MLLGGLKHDTGQVPTYKNIDSEQKMLRMAKFLAKEKRLREKRRRQELRRSQQMIDSILQFSIMMNSGASNLMQNFNFPQLQGIQGDLGMFQNMASNNNLGSIGPSGGNLYLDPKHAQAVQQGNSPFGTPGMNSPAPGSQGGKGKSPEELEEERLRKKKRKRRKRKKEKRRRKMLQEQKMREIRERELEDERRAAELMNNKANDNQQLAYDELDRERKLDEEAEKERLRREQEAKDAKELAIRKQEERFEQ